jgi:hypothetical protein
VLVVSAATASAGASASEPGVPPCAGAPRSHAPADRPARASDLKLVASAEWSATRGQTRVTWIVKVTNRTDAALHVVHPSSRYAVVLLRRMGRVVYRSPSGGALPAFWDWTLPPRATFACSLAPDTLDADALKTGRYDLAAYLSLHPLDLEAHRPVSIVGG